MGYISTYTYPINEKFDYSSVDNHPKLTNISKNVFLAMKSTVNKFSHFFVTVKKYLSERVI